LSIVAPFIKFQTAT